MTILIISIHPWASIIISQLQQAQQNIITKPALEQAMIVTIAPPILLHIILKILNKH
jgi:hypothetical protein